jgi:transposase InsO family protein
MSMARLVVAAIRMEGRSQSEVAAHYGLSRRWVHELLKRYDVHGEDGLEPRSRRPLHSPQRTSDEVEDRIVELRKALIDQGLDAGAHTIAFHLGQVVEAVPSVATIWRILSRRGFVTPQPQKRPKSSFVRFCAELPNQRWQADITHWELADGADVEICNWVDDHSRLLVGSAARWVYKAADVVATFHDAAGRHGYPASVLTDNGAVFTASPRGGGRCAIEVECDTLGIRLHHSRPYHPQTCGKVERFHQTLKRWLARQPRASTVGALQRQLDWFRGYYNTSRPHRALGRRTPQAAFEARPKDRPSLPGLVLPAHCRIRRDRVDANGKLTLRYNSRLHHIGLGRRHAGLRVLLLVADSDVRVITEEGELLRAFRLDPTRDYQPQAPA